MLNNILLVGTVSNVAKTIEKELRTVLKALESFDKIEIFLVESDSNDNTVEILKSIQEGNKNFTFVTKGHLSNRYPNRIARIAYWVFGIIERNTGRRILVPVFNRTRDILVSIIK